MPEQGGFGKVYCVNEVCDLVSEENAFSPNRFSAVERFAILKLTVEEQLLTNHPNLPMPTCISTIISPVFLIESSKNYVINGTVHVRIDLFTFSQICN